MKRKSVLRIGTALLCASFVMAGVNGNISRIVLAEDFVEFEDEEDAFSETPEGASENVETVEIVEVPEDEEIVGDEEILLESEVEILLPQTSVFMPASEFLPVKEEEKTFFLNPYSDLYLLHIENDSESLYTLFFNQVLKEKDLTLYRFDGEKNMVVDPEPVQDVMRLEENSGVLSLDLETDSDCLLVISHADIYQNLGYTSKFTITHVEEMEEPTTEEELTTETEAPTLVSVKLNLDQEELQDIPAAFLPYLGQIGGYSVILTFSDETEMVLDEGNEHFTMSVQYEDVTDEDGNIYRTYYAVVKDLSTEEEFEDTQEIVFYNNPEGEMEAINPGEMTTVKLKGKGNWVMVQTVPEITGHYSMKSFGKNIKNMYYITDGSGLMYAEEVFELEQDITYTFLIEF